MDSEEKDKELAELAEIVEYATGLTENTVIVAALIQAQVQLRTNNKICKEIKELKHMLKEKRMYSVY